MAHDIIIQSVKCEMEKGVDFVMRCILQFYERDEITVKAEEEKKHAYKEGLQKKLKIDPLCLVHNSFLHSYPQKEMGTA